MSQARQTIVLTGGGSGGHITPLLAVAAKIKQLSPKTHLVYIGQRGDRLADIPTEDPNIDETVLVRAGKFRRYHGEGARQLLDIKAMALNARDFFSVIIGLKQSRSQLKKINPNAIFIKGGYIGVPVGLAAASLHLPYITHDSDAIPGLANRIIARWAALHAVALPADIYHYPAAKTITTGIPLQVGFEPVTDKLKAKYRDEIDIPKEARLLFVIGGGLGAESVNLAVANALPNLLRQFEDLYVIQSAGRNNEERTKQFYKTNLSPAEQGRVHVFGFVKDVYCYSGAADLVITRAGATNLAEFALQGKACIVVPNPALTGGHQLKNAEYLAEQRAVAIINETDLVDDPNRLAKQINELLLNPMARQKLAENFAKFAKPAATQDLAKLILEQAGQHV